MPPAITNISIDNDVIEGGQPVQITGTGFHPNVRVRIGGANAAIQGAVTATQIDVLAPKHARCEQVQLEVRNPTGAPATIAFYYRPLVQKVEPDAGPIGGGTAVSIHGEGFHGALTVEFNNVAAVGVTVVSATQITCTTPAYVPAVAAFVDVDVFLPPGGAMGTRLDEGFGYAAPMITGVAPPVLPLSGGNITVSGRFFSGAAAAAVDAAPIVPTVTSDTEIVLAAPAHAAGPVLVSITNGVAATLANALTYAGAKIAAVTPKRGPANQITRVRITGERFAGVPGVDVGGNASVPAAATATTIDVDAPAHGAGPADVVVTNAGEPAVTLVDGFTYVAQPTLTAVDPPVGRTAGGDALTLTGTAFEPEVTVTIGGNAADVQFVSTTTLTVITHPHTAGTVAVVATNPNGNSRTLGGAFTYTDLTAVEPKRGPAAGGTVVTIRGAGFAATDGVNFGGTAAAAVTFVNSTTLTVTTPAHAAGAVNVVVGANKTLTNGFTFSTVTKINPDEGARAGGLRVTIDGEGFGAGMTVEFGLHNNGLNVTPTSATRLTVDTPAGGPGAVDVIVRRQTRLANAFTFYDPVVASNGAAAFAAILPKIGRTAGGTPVVVRGVGFGDDAAVTIGGQPATVTARTANEIRAVTPVGAAAGAVRVEVSWSGVGEHAVPVTAAQDAAFTYQDVMPVEPAAGPAGGGTVVTITGAGFGDGLAVTIGAAAGLNVIVDSATQARATTPAVAAATVDVVVVREGRATAGFTYYDAAQVNAIDPRDGLVGGGRVVTIRGQGFCRNPAVTIGGTVVTSMTRHSDTTLEVRTAAHVAAAGMHVVVTNPNTVAATLPASFTYRDTLTVTAVAPPRGPVEGRRWITVTGTDIVRGATVLVDDVAVPAADTVYTNATTISARVPAHAAGQVDVAVRNPGELAVTRLNLFEYVVTPAETGENDVLFLMDGEEYFTELQNGMNAVRQAAPDPLTYVRLAFWLIEKEVRLGDRNCQRWPHHQLLAYIDQVIRAGHNVDVIMWEPGQAERQFSEAKGVRPVNIEFGRAVQALDRAVAGIAAAGRARVYHERYEGPVGSSTHQKIAIFSIAGQRTVLLGGLNLSSHYFADTDHELSTWHDAAVRLIGPATDDVEAEWVRRWKKTATEGSNRVLQAFGAAGVIRARGFAYDLSATLRTAALKLKENTTKQAAQAANHSLAIATTRAVGDTRYRKLRDLLLEKIAGAMAYIYMENYHFTDPEIVRAIYRRHDQRRAAGVELRIVIVVPIQGGGSGYLTRRSWLQLVLRLANAGGPYVTRVHYNTGAGAQTVDHALCNLWGVRDSFDRNEAGKWFQNDKLLFRLTAGVGGVREVPFSAITSVEGTLHFYSCFDMGGGDFRRNIYNHAKIAIIDDFLVVGSANWSYRSLQYDGEISAFINSNPLATGALGRLLGHYDLVTVINENIIEAEATTNEAGVVGAAVVDVARQGAINAALNKLVLLPLCFHGRPELALPTAPPAGLEEPPDYTWL
ncbi:MAG: hypothetical protein QOI58_1647 [Thermoanaerobaculia bacterium]|jgi:phosphatidylserine/phosphatidylglycerophosphate/cardiolipin synthase-like enzyme|nr:hypothetical protein [Thermoanaerobaculia bacterium]